MFGQKTPSPWFFDSSVHLEAVSRLLFLVDSHESIGFVFGSDGSGRTRVLSRLKEELQRTDAVIVSLKLAGLDNESILWQLSNGVGALVRSGMKRHEQLSVLRDELLGRGQCGIQTVVLLDDIHRAVDDLNPLLQLLVSLNPQCHGLLTVIAASDRSLLATNLHLALVRVSLSALDPVESSDFVRTLVRRHLISGSVIDETAVKALADAANGNAARISRICELLRAVHEASPNTRLTGETVRAVLDELAPRAVA